MDTIALTGGLQRWEERVLRGTRRTLGFPAAIGAARGLSLFGEHAAGWLAVGALGALADPAHRDRWVRGAVSVAAAHAASSAVKRVVRRARPVLEDAPLLVRTASSLSFPSSHMASTAAAAVAYGPLLGRGPLAGAAVAMACSRVLLGAHYASDVTAGAALGVACARLLTRR